METQKEDAILDFLLTISVSFMSNCKQNLLFGPKLEPNSQITAKLHSMVNIAVWV